MSEITLRSWELPVGCPAPLSAPIDAEIEAGKIRMVETEKGIFWVFFQPRNHWQSHYLVRELIRSEPARWKTRKSPDELAKIIRKATRGDQFSLARFFFLSAPQNAVVFWSQKECSWINLQSLPPFGERSRVAFHVWPSVQKRASPLVHQWILEQWEKADSQVSFSWQWARMSHDERIALLYPEADDFRELLRLMKWVVQCDAQLSEVVDEFLGAGQDIIWPLFRYYRNDSNHVIPMLTRQSARWGHLLRTHFHSLPPLEMFRPPLCVKEWDKEMREIPTVRTHRVSLHERLEARQNLRDWLQINAPEQIERLLPQK